MIPGYGKASILQKKLNTVHVPKPVESAKPGVPSELQGLFESEADLQRIVVMNR